MCAFLLGCVLKEKRCGGHEPAIQGGEGADGICAIGVCICRIDADRAWKGGSEELRSHDFSMGIYAGGGMFDGDVFSLNDCWLGLESGH